MRCHGYGCDLGCVDCDAEFRDAVPDRFDPVDEVDVILENRDRADRQTGIAR